MGDDDDGDDDEGNDDDGDDDADLSVKTCPTSAQPAWAKKCCRTEYSAWWAYGCYGVYMDCTDDCVHNGDNEDNGLSIRVASLATGGAAAAEMVTSRGRTSPIAPMTVAVAVAAATILELAS